MRERVYSSFVVVAFGLLSTLIGGPAFAAAMFGLGAAGFMEFTRLAQRAIGAPSLRGARWGLAVIAAMSAAALAGSTGVVQIALVALAVSAPLIAQLGVVNEPAAISAWSLISAGTLYLGLPVLTAIELRSLPGNDVAAWLAQIDRSLAFAWPSRPLGLAWVMVVVLATWIGDSAAYLVGRSVGQRRMVPRISPNKTWEGALGGIAGSAITGAAALVLFELGPWWFGAVVGCILGGAGQVGDLCESFLKRQAGVKDSGDMLPGHGGILDRVDALLFALPVAYFLAVAYEGSGLR